MGPRTCPHIDEGTIHHGRPAKAVFAGIGGEHARNLAQSEINFRTSDKTRSTPVFGLKAGLRSILYCRFKFTTWP